MPEENKNMKINEGLSQIVPHAVIKVFNAEGTSAQILKICSENNLLKAGDIENVGYGVGLVLLGQLLPHKLPTFLEKMLKINGELAQKIYKRVDEVIFSPIKDDLSKIYEAKSAEQKSVSEMPEKLQKPQGKDIYREPAE